MLVRIGVFVVWALLCSLVNGADVEPGAPIFKKTLSTKEKFIVSKRVVAEKDLNEEQKFFLWKLDGKVVQGYGTMDFYDVAIESEDGKSKKQLGAIGSPKTPTPWVKTSFQNVYEFDNGYLLVYQNLGETSIAFFSQEKLVDVLSVARASRNLIRIVSAEVIAKPDDNFGELTLIVRKVSGADSSEEKSEINYRLSISKEKRITLELKKGALPEELAPSLSLTCPNGLPKH